MRPACDPICPSWEAALATTDDKLSPDAAALTCDVPWRSADTLTKVFGTAATNPFRMASQCVYISAALESTLFYNKDKIVLLQYHVFVGKNTV